MIGELLSDKNERTLIEYKAVQYDISSDKYKYELLKDISALANNLSDEEKLIICGVKHKNDGFEVIGVSPVDESSFGQLIHSNIEPNINFEYLTEEFDEKLITYFRIFKNTNRPYRIKKDYGNGKFCHKKGDGYIRKGTRCEKMVREDFEAIYKSRYYSFDESNIELGINIRRKLLKIGASFHEATILELSILNKSNKYVDIDIELKLVSKESDIDLIEVLDLENRVLWDSPFRFLNRDDKKNETKDFHIYNELDGKKILLKKRRSDKSALCLSPMTKENDIYNGGLIIDTEKAGNYKIEFEITLKSDIYIEGYKKLKLQKSFTIR